MLLIDDLVTAPGKFVLWIFEQVHDAAKKELADESGRITARLQELHQALERGRISEKQFDAQEKRLLDRLDELEAAAQEHDDDLEQASARGG